MVKTTPPSDQTSSENTSSLSQQRYLTPKQLVAFLGRSIKEKTLSNWRCDKKGPAYIRISNRVLYPYDEVLRWAQQRKE